jgi:hypothetical protein
MVRDKLRLSDLNVLFVYLEEGPHPIIDRVITDLTNFRNLGGNPMLICRKGSSLDKKAEREDIPREYVQSKKLLSLGYELFQIVNFLRREQRLDLVHSYSYDPLLVFGFLLKRDNRIPLIYTCNEKVSDLYRPFWHDYFVTRLDQVITFSPIMLEQLKERLPFLKRKIFLSGAGIELRAKPNLAKPEGTLKLCAYVSGTQSDVESFLPLLINLPLLEIHGVRTILSLVTEGSWFEHPHFEKFKRTILERGLEHFVSFHPQPWGSVALSQHHIFVSVSTSRPFDEHELSALMCRLPVLIPRTSVRSDMIGHERLGLTYQSGDSREMRAKILEIYHHYGRFTHFLELDSEGLHEKHGFDTYVSELFNLYERVSLQRLRFSLKKGRIRASKA